MSLLGSVVVKDGEVEESYFISNSKETLTLIKTALIPKIEKEAADVRKILSYEEYMIYILKENDIAYICVATSSYMQRACWGLLLELAQQFGKQKNFKSYMKERTKFHADSNNDRINNLMNKSEQAKDLISKQIDTLVNRVNVDALENQADELNASTSAFKKSGKQLKRKECIIN